LPLPETDADFTPLVVDRSSNSLYFLKPLNGRDAAKLSTLVAGTVMISTSTETGKGIPGNFYLSANGSGTGQVSYRLDGNTNTFKLVSGGEVNVNFFMLVPPFTLKGAVSGGTITLSFKTQPGFAFQPQYKTNLTDAPWLNLGAAIPGDGTVKSVNDTATESHRFYRFSVR